MKAAVHESYGPPDVLRIAEIPKPAPGPHEILVGIRCSSVNRTDAGFLRA
jgi:NADPH:quinone reductase-like Zn-dependent oxidoreductase